MLAAMKPSKLLTTSNLEVESRAIAYEKAAGRKTTDARYGVPAGVHDFCRNPRY